MGKYGSGVSMKEMFNMEREALKMALKGQIRCGANENGFIYCPGDEEEIHQTIWEIYRNAEWHAKEMAASARAMERLAEKYSVRSEDHFKEYMMLMMEERAKGGVQDKEEKWK